MRTLEVIAFQGLVTLARVLPRRWIRTAGSWVGLVAHGLDARHRRITRNNLRLAYGPELTETQVRRIARRCWAQFGRNIFDALTFQRLGPESVGTVVHYEGLEHIRSAYARGQGVLLFSGHFGQWELTALMQGFLNMPLLLVTRRLDNPGLERMLASLRQRSGNRIVHKRNAVREMVRALREGHGVAIVIDQDARSSGVFVPFFGRLASTTPTLARIALRTGAAVIPSFCVPRPDGSYVVTYEPEVPVAPTGDLQADTNDLTARCTAILERWVRRHPEQWMWMHRRWKTQAPVTEPMLDGGKP